MPLAGEESGWYENDVPNNALFASRLDHIDQIIKPWLDKVANEGGTRVVSDLVLEKSSLMETTREAKERFLLRNIKAILEIALPTPPVSTLAVEEETLATKVSADREVRVPGDAIYSRLSFDHDGGGEQIRLLELLPGEHKDAVQAKMFVIDSTRHHEYDALSYVWGAQIIRCAIVLNGQPYTVGTNLHDALVSLRLPDRARRLWVDALCINQMDDDEKNTQIRLMGSIYREARNVIIFLGMPTAKSYALFEVLNRNKRTKDVAEGDGLAIIEECGLNSPDVVASFVEFCDREWWDRVWVMQEHYLAVRTPLWYIGSQYFEGEKLCRDVLALAREISRISQQYAFRKDLVRVLGHRSFASVLERVSKIIVGVYLRRDTGPYKTPRQLLAWHNRLASNPSDHVYGLREMLEPHFREVFVPDYKLALPSLFEKLAACLLLMDGWGDMFWNYPFHCPAGTLGEPAGPSWVPDFSRRPRRAMVEPAPDESADQSLNPVLQCAIIGRTLYMEGCHLDDIKEIVDIPTGDRFQVLQKVWQLDRIHCSNQRQRRTPSRDRSARALLAWSSSSRSMPLPLAWRWDDANKLVLLEFEEHLDRAWAKVMASSEVTANAVAAYERQMLALVNLHAFLSKDMECDFLSACTFDFKNLDTQLEVAGEAPEPQEGLDRILSTHGAHEVVYDDLVSAIQSINGAGDVETFRLLVAVVRRTADRIHRWVHAGLGHTHLNGRAQTQAASSTQIVEKLLDDQEPEAGKFDKGWNDVADSTGMEAEMNGTREISPLGDQVSITEPSLKPNVDNQARSKQLTNSNDTEGSVKDPGWGFVDEETVAQFQGRQFFVTKRGLLGLASPGVSDAKVGDQIVLLDGLTFPLIARPHPDSRFAVVGCANIREVVKLRHKVEDAELWEGTGVGPRRMMAFV